MADAEEKAKAEKLAAAKKRVEALKKKSAKKSGVKKEEKAEPAAASTSKSEASEPAKKDDAVETVDAVEPVTEEIAAEEDVKSTESEAAEDAGETVADLQNPARQRQPSISVQSKMRSSSFRAGAGPLSPSGFPFSPEGDTAPDIYRKQALRIEELEKENKKLAKEATEGEKRWKKAEEELEDLREADDGPKEVVTATSDSSGEVEKLKTEKAALLRQLTQLQAQAARTTRHGSSPSISVSPQNTDLLAELASKSTAIEGMEIEISNLRARLDASTSTSPEKEQITALEEKLLRSEKAAQKAERELGDLKKNLERTTEKAVKEGSERISAETKLRSLTTEVEAARSNSEELQKKVDALEKKVAALGTLHKEHDARSQASKRAHEKVEKEASDLRVKLGTIENENLRLKEERERSKKRDAQGVDDEGVDELENEERQRLEAKVRELESENHDLRSGAWRERRKELGFEDDSGLASPGARFTDIDLHGSSPTRRRSIAPNHAAGKGIGDFFTSGFNAITGATAYNEKDELLEDDDELLDFDEDAFRAAQEEEMKKRIERVKEVKRGLKNWEGWRLDIVENRRGGGEGVGEIFEI